MSGPDRRESFRSGRRVTNMGLDDEFGMDAPEDYTFTVHAGKRHYHVWGEVLSSFSAGDGTESVVRIVTDDIDADFYASAVLTEWNGQEIIGDTDNSVRTTRAEYVALDVAGEFIESLEWGDNG